MSGGIHLIKAMLYGIGAIVFNGSSNSSSGLTPQMKNSSYYMYYHNVQNVPYLRSMYSRLDNELFRLNARKVNAVGKLITSYDSKSSCKRYEFLESLWFIDELEAKGIEYDKDVLLLVTGYLYKKLHMQVSWDETTLDERLKTAKYLVEFNPDGTTRRVNQNLEEIKVKDTEKEDEITYE